MFNYLPLNGSYKDFVPMISTDVHVCMYYEYIYIFIYIYIYVFYYIYICIKLFLMYMFGYL